jgi:hypothetical protein
MDRILGLFEFFWAMYNIVFVHVPSYRPKIPNQNLQFPSLIINFFIYVLINSLFVNYYSLFFILHSNKFSTSVAKSPAVTYLIFTICI